MGVILFYHKLGESGGISPDLRHLEQGLRDNNYQVLATSRLTDLMRSSAGPGTIVNVYGCLPSVRNLSAIFIARLRRQRLIWTPVFHPLRQSIWRGSGRYQIMALFDRAAPYLARLTHAVSAATDEEACFFKAKGAPRVAVVPLVVAATYGRHLDACRKAARARLGVVDGPMILMVAAHSPRRKGLDFAVSTLRELRRTLPDVTCVVVGGGDLGPLASEPAVHALGWCPDGVLIDAYRSADVLFVPSLYEQFSRATIEAWACELPVVLSDRVALAHIASSQGTGIVVPYPDATAAAGALHAALTDIAWQEQAGRRARVLVTQRFMPEAHVQSTLDLYAAATPRAMEVQCR